MANHSPDTVAVIFMASFKRVAATRPEPQSQVWAKAKTVSGNWQHLES